jgi:glyoxylase-like metal-dependent hydrolase (beta-lactamase superfamily II)
VRWETVPYVADESIQSLATRTSASQPSQPYKTHQPTAIPNSPLVHSFFDDATATFTFVVVCPKTKDAFVIDPVLDFDLASGKISQKSVKGLAEFIKQQGYNVVRIIETHVHADHLTGAHVLKKVSDHSSTCLSQLTLIQLD